MLTPVAKSSCLNLQSGKVGAASFCDGRSIRPGCDPDHVDGGYGDDVLPSILPIHFSLARRSSLRTQCGSHPDR